MLALVREEGTTSKKQKETLDMQAQFYQRLYTSDPDINFRFEKNNQWRIKDFP